MALRIGGSGYSHDFDEASADSDTGCFHGYRPAPTHEENSLGAGPSCATRSFQNSSKNLLSDCRTSSGRILKYLDCIGDAVEKSSVNSAKHMNCVSSAKAIYRCGNTGDLRISVSNWCTLGCAIQELVTFALIDSNAFMTSAVVALCALFA